MSINTKCFIVVTKKKNNTKNEQMSYNKRKFQMKIFFLFFEIFAHCFSVKIPIYFDLAYGVVK